MTSRGCKQGVVLMLLQVLSLQTTTNGEAKMKAYINLLQLCLLVAVQSVLQVAQQVPGVTDQEVSLACCLEARSKLTHQQGPDTCCCS